MSNIRELDLWAAQLAQRVADEITAKLGKECVRLTIHYTHVRSGTPQVDVDCAFEDQP